MFLKYNKKFPYRTLQEIYGDTKTFINDIGMLYHNKMQLEDMHNMLLDLVFKKYQDRYPYEQDMNKLSNRIYEIFNTYFDTFILNISRFSNADDIDKYYENIINGNSVEYSSKHGSTSSPYNLKYNDNGEDFLWNKNLGDSTQTYKNTDIIKRSFEIKQSKLNGEIQDFVNSFYSLFSSIDLSDKIDNYLEMVINAYKDDINTIIDIYNNDIKPKIK